MFTFLHNQVSDDREKVKWTRWLSVSTTFVSVALVTLLELKLLSIAGFKNSMHIYIYVINCCNFLITVQFSIMDSCDSSVIGIFSLSRSRSLNRLTITQFYAMHITAERKRERGHIHCGILYELSSLSIRNVGKLPSTFLMSRSRPTHRAHLSFCPHNLILKICN